MEVVPALPCPLIRRTKLSQSPQQILSHLRGMWPHQNLHDHSPGSHFAPGVAQNEVSIQCAQERGEGHLGQVASIPSCSWGETGVDRSKHTIVNLEQILKQFNNNISYNPRSGKTLYGVPAVY